MISGMRMACRFLLLVSIAASGSGPIRADDTARKTYRFADAHLHYVDFFQDSEGMASLFRAMDAANVRDVALMGMPLTKKWHENEPRRPRYYLGDDAPLYWYSATDAILAEAVRSLPASKRRRIHPFLSGINPDDKNATLHIEHMIRLYPDFWEGIGEVMTRHDHLTALVQGDVPRADSEAMMRIYRMAARHDLPVLLHSNVTSLRERDLIYLDELRNALERNPRTRIIWAHAGTSGTVNRWQERMPGLVEAIDALLSEHDNLWIDLSWSVLEPHILDGDDDPRRAWLALVRKHPDRFMLGSDLVGRFDSLDRTMQRFVALLDALPPDVARKVAHDNFMSVLPSRPARLGEEEGRDE